ncbi:MAG: diguanylate cyclase [Lachnospiraceae bacterium]|nr:diguanylate cyclase [Lachnospiraceae bacterium]
MKKKILIVDDEAVSLMITENILNTEYETACAASGEEAIEIYEKFRPDLILSDIRMPQMNGFELQKNLKEKYSVKVPFIYITSDREEDIESQGLETGAVDFIHKPFRADVLLKRIGNILRMIDQIYGLKQAAVKDPLTGLLNKASSKAEIAELCKKSRGALMVVDLDSFKPVNDLYGHSMGDKVLVRFSKILQSVVRITDITGRMGGDEFIIFCQNINEPSVIEEKTKYINEQIVAAAHELMGDDCSIPIGASIGCVFAPDEGTDFDSLFDKADGCLYKVKQRGKHGCEIYVEPCGNEQEEHNSVNNIQSIFQIMAERNPESGAYKLAPEEFKYIYRFLSRIVINYKKEIWALLFSIHQTGTGAITLEDVSEQFMESTRKTLRHSDVITQNSKNQVMALLSETTRGNCDTVVERIMRNWEKMGEDTGYTITCAIDKITV